jgi:hypothetical protein
MPGFGIGTFSNVSPHPLMPSVVAVATAVTTRPRRDVLRCDRVIFR